MTDRPLGGLRPVHPGEVLRTDVLPSLSVSRAELARSLGMTAGALDDLLRGKATLSSSTAAKLERFIGGSKEMWCRLQHDHDLALSSFERDDCP